MDNRILFYTVMIGLLLSSTKPLLASESRSLEGAPEEPYSDLATAQWLHGADNCKNDKNPLIQVMQADASSYVLRQNKCTTFEAPFIYVLVGSEKILVVDTGAIESSKESPVYKTIKSLMREQESESSTASRELLVVHSHSHSDHTKGDAQFSGLKGVKIVGTNTASIEESLGLADWPNQTNSMDLGDRAVTFIPIPGHQEQSIAVYDHQTEWLLTGDTFYPGALRVKNWAAYKNSIERLLSFSMSHPVSLILGAHIEMNVETKKPYRIGTTYQPNEPPLGLQVSHLRVLNDKLQTTKKAKKLKFDSFVVSPLSRFEKMMSNLLTKKKRGAKSD